MKIFLTLLLTVGMTITAHPVDIPDFSFRGEEVASFAITPTFRDIDLKISVPSAFTNYVQKQTIAITGEDSLANYEADTPGFMYGSSFTTGVASIFVGEKAYRNFMVKKYLNARYPAYVQNYEKYAAKVENPEYKEEIELLMAASEIANMDKAGERRLYNLCLTGEFFQNEACDKYIEILWNRKNYSSIIDAAGRIRRPLTEYVFSAYALSSFRRGEYTRAYNLVRQNPDTLFNHPDFNDFRAVLEYYNSNYAAVTALMPYTTDNISFVNADSLINTGRYKEAEAAVAALPDATDRDYLNAKLMIATRRYKALDELLGRITDEDSRFALMRLYVANEFPNLDQRILGTFRFTDPVKAAYPVYYTGLARLELKDYRGAAQAFERVTAPPELAASATFYRGIALVYIDPEAAEQDIVRTMNASSDPSQIAASRFMLAQVYYMKGSYDPALQLVESCDAIYCKQLISEIYLRQNRYERAITTVDGINTPQAHFVRASAYYNLLQYDKSRQELDLTGSTAREALHLRMMLNFKEGNTTSATAILTANRDYTPILYDGVRELMLAGDYRLPLRLLEDEKNLPPEMQVVHARLLGWLGREDEAREIYSRLLRSRILVYDALFGLLSLEKTHEEELQQIYRIVKELQTLGDFPQRDLLLTQLAAKASRANDKVLLIQIINMFFPEYTESEYAGEMFHERAKLFYSTGRFPECLQDISLAERINPIYEEELRFQKAQCIEHVNMSEALGLYQVMFENDARYRLPSAVKLMDLSPDGTQVLSVAEEIRGDSPQLYVEGVRRYMGIAKPEELGENEAFLTALTKDKNKALVCAGLYGSARLANEKGSGRDAAKLHYQVYQTDQNDHFAIPALEAAAAIYTQLKMTKEAAETQELLTKLKARKK